MRSRALLAAAVVFVAACGARSTLRDPPGISSGSGGTGGAGTSTGDAVATTGPSATTGVGGTPFNACPVLVSPGGPFELPVVDPMVFTRDPQLVLLAQGDVLALVRNETQKPPMFAPAPILAMRLDPWGAWPPKLQPPVKVAEGKSGVPFVAAAEANGTFALGLEPVPTNPPAGCDLQAIYGLSPDAPPGPGALAVDIKGVGTCTNSPVSVATAGNGTHLAAMLLTSMQGLSLEGLNVQVLDAGGAALQMPYDTCADTPVLGDALPTPTGFLFAQSAYDVLSCGGPGPAHKLFLRRFEGKNDDSILVYDGVDDLVYTRILPRKGGSWILYRESGASAVVQPPGMALPFGTDSATGEAFPITDPGAGSMVAAPINGGFVVAIVDSLDPSAPTITLRLYSAEGTLSAQTSFSTNPAWLNGDRVSLVASPDGKSVLVGWAGQHAGPGSSMFVRRFDCADHQ